MNLDTIIKQGLLAIGIQKGMKFALIWFPFVFVYAVIYLVINLCMRFPKSFMATAMIIFLTKIITSL